MRIINLWGGFLLLSLFLSSCSVKKTSAQKTIIPLSDNSCFDDRATTATLSSERGVMLQLNTDLWIITTVGGSRYQLCETPNSLKINELHIIFSGEEKAIKPTERRVATPLKVTAIEVLKQ